MLDESTPVNTAARKEDRNKSFSCMHACVYGKKNIIIELKINMDVFRKKINNKKDVEHV